MRTCPASIGCCDFLHRLLLLALLATVSACGFHLRGGVALAPVLEDTYLKSNDPYSGISAALRSELQAAGARLVSDAQQASAVINVRGSRSLRRAFCSEYSS